MAPVQICTQEIDTEERNISLGIVFSCPFCATNHSQHNVYYVTRIKSITRQSSTAIRLKV